MVWMKTRSPEDRGGTGRARSRGERGNELGESILCLRQQMLWVSEEPSAPKRFTFCQGVKGQAHPMVWPSLAQSPASAMPALPAASPQRSHFWMQWLLPSPNSSPQPRFEDLTLQLLALLLSGATNEISCHFPLAAPEVRPIVPQGEDA